MTKFTKSLLAVTALLFLSPLICAQEGTRETVEKTSFNLLGSGSVFKLDAKTDTILLSSTGTLAATMLVLDNFTSVGKEKYDGSKLDKSDIPSFDQIFMNSYSKGLDITATVFQVAAMATPLMLLGTSNEEWFTIGTMYLETVLMAYGIKELGKLLIDRPRPYMYYSDFPKSEADNGDWNCSFPSGHTTMSFASAAFTSYVFFQYFPESPWRWAVLGGTYTLALATASLRMASGNHFFTDVLTGMFIGTISGFIVPWLHTRKLNNPEDKKSGLQAEISPLGFNLKVSF